MNNIIPRTFLESHSSALETGQARMEEKSASVQNTPKRHDDFSCMVGQKGEVLTQMTGVETHN